MSPNAPPNFDESMPVLALRTTLLTLLASIVGAFAAVAVLPLWLPGLSASLQGDQTKPTGTCRVPAPSSPTCCSGCRSRWA